MLVGKYYGIDYKIYACSGKDNVKLVLAGENRELFHTESEMFERLSKLKKSCSYDNFELFTLTKEEYKI